MKTDTSTFTTNFVVWVLPTVFAIFPVFFLFSGIFRYFLYFHVFAVYVSVLLKPWSE